MMKLSLLAASIAFVSAGGEECPYNYNQELMKINYKVAQVNDADATIAHANTQAMWGDLQMMPMMLSMWPEGNGWNKTRTIEAFGTYSHELVKDFAAYKQWCHTTGKESHYYSDATALSANSVFSHMPCQAEGKKTFQGGVCDYDFANMVTTVVSVGEWERTCFQDYKFGDAGCIANTIATGSSKCHGWKSLSGFVAAESGKAAMMVPMMAAAMPSLANTSVAAVTADMTAFATYRYNRCVADPLLRNFPKTDLVYTPQAPLFVATMEAMKNEPNEKCFDDDLSLFDAFQDRPGAPVSGLLDQAADGTLSMSPNGCAKDPMFVSESTRGTLGSSPLYTTLLNKLNHAVISVDDLKDKYKAGACCGGNCVIQTSTAKITVL